MLKQKLIVISMDALIAEDIDYLKDKPNFRWMLENGSWVEQVRSIYPTLTYPCHTTMASGCYPAKHGIVNNTHLCGETTEADILHGAELAAAVSRLTNIPVLCHTAAQHLADNLTALPQPVFPIQIHMKKPWE